MARRIVGAILLVLLTGSLGYKLEQELGMVSDYPVAVAMIVLLFVRDCFPAQLLFLSMMRFLT